MRRYKDALRNASADPATLILVTGQQLYGFFRDIVTPMAGPPEPPTARALTKVRHNYLMRHVVIVGPPPVQILDVAGPLEVFSSAPGYSVHLASPGTMPRLETSRGCSLSAASLLRELSFDIDTLVIAGGPGAESAEQNAELVSWVAREAPKCRRVASICTGVFVLAAAGLLTGKSVVTHWKFCARLAEEYPATRVDPDPIFLRDGNLYTSAGITAGIDLCLALVEEDCGHEIALQIARQLVMFLVRPGGQAQFSQMLSVQQAASQSLREIQIWAREHLRSNLTVDVLAARMNVSARHFVRLCKKDLLMTPAEMVMRLRVEAAQQLIDTSTKGLKEIAGDCGFSSAEIMRRAFLRILGVTANDYGTRFRRPSAKFQVSEIVANMS